MKGFVIILIFIIFANNTFSQYNIRGRVIDSDTIGISFAEVRLPGFDSQTTDQHGYFTFQVSEEKCNAYKITGGVDLFVEVKKENMVILEPPDQKLRLAFNPDIQPHFQIILVNKGSLLLVKNEKMLDHILRQKIDAAVSAKEEEFDRRDILAEEAVRLGISKEMLLTAVESYKDMLRSSPDLNKRGLAALDDMYAASDYKIKKAKGEEAKKYFRGAITKDEKMVREAQQAESRLPEEYYNLGLTFFEEARYDSSLYYFSKADSLSPNNLTRLNMLGRSLSELALHERSLIAYNKALFVARCEFPSDHPEVATILNNIAVVLESRGDYDGALEKHNEALSIDEAYFGRNHPNVATGLNNIAVVLKSRGDYDGALEKLNEALGIDEAYYGRNHPSVARILNNIAVVLESRGDYAGALEKYNEALSIDEAYFGRNHPSVARILNNIAVVLKSRGDYAGALEKYNEALSIDEAYYGRNHPRVARILNNIAVVLELRGDYDGALEKYNEALRIDEAYFGRNHPRVARILNNIAGVLKSRGDYDGALEKYNEALSIDEAYFGRNHPRVARILNNIAVVLESRGDYDGALEKYNEALSIDEAYFWRNHPRVARILNNIAVVLKSRGDYDGALEKFNEALSIDEAYFGRNHPDVARDLNNIAVVLASRGDYAGALEKYNEALSIDEAYYGRNHPDVAIDLNNIAVVLKSRGDYDGALEKHNEALSIDEAYFGRNHPDVARDLNNIAVVLASRGDYAGALEKYNEALSILEIFFEPEHPNVITVRNNRDQVYKVSLSEKDRWYLLTQDRVLQLNDTSVNFTNPVRMELLNAIGVGYIKQAKADSALIYLNEALPIALKLKDKKMEGNLLNNLGSAHKLCGNWTEAEKYIRRSIEHNSEVLGENAAVLAYSYFHLSGIFHSRAQLDSAKVYGEKSRVLAEKNNLEELLYEINELLETISINRGKHN